MGSRWKSQKIFGEHPRMARYLGGVSHALKACRKLFCLGANSGLCNKVLACANRRGMVRPQPLCDVPLDSLPVQAVHRIGILDVRLCMRAPPVPLTDAWVVPVALNFTMA